MFLEFETRDGDWMCINVDQIIMVQGIRTDGTKGYTRIHLRDGVVIETRKPYSSLIKYLVH